MLGESRAFAQFVVDVDRLIELNKLCFPAMAEQNVASYDPVFWFFHCNLDRLWHATPAFPTISEMWLRFLESYGL